MIKRELYIACTGVSISTEGFVSYFAHRSRLLFSRKKETSSLNNIVNKKCIQNLNENVLMMCFHQDLLVLHYAISHVNAILQSIFHSFTQNLFMCKSM